MELKDLIDVIPDIINFILPGYITLLIIQYLTNAQFREADRWVVSAAISFITISALECIASVMGNSWLPWGLTLACFGVDIVAGAIIALVLKSESYNKLLEKSFMISNKRNLIDYYRDRKNGTNVLIVLKSTGEQILGHLDVYDDANCDMIGIREPVFYDKNGAETLSREGQDTKLIVPFGDIKYIEML